VHRLAFSLAQQIQSYFRVLSEALRRMSFRNRPILNRKHRPRWQDELRTQQLVVAGFAMAIAVAVGIFAAASWSDFYQANLRQAALVGGQPIERGDLETRINIIGAEILATAADLDSQSGGARDQGIQQQLGSLQTAFNQIEQEGADSLVTGTLLDRLAAQYGLSVSSESLDAAVADRRTIPERRQLSLIMSAPEKDEGAAGGAKPTDKNWADAKARAVAIKAELEGGGDFAALARERSDDPSKSSDGLLGWIQDEDAQYGEYYTAAADADVGALLGPLKNDSGWYLLKVGEVRPAGDNGPLRQNLGNSGVSDDAYRDYVRQELLRGQYRDYFTDTLVTPYQSQRKVSQILINNDETPSPKSKIRHLLVAPLPGVEDQSTATPKQWRAALLKAGELRAEAVKPGADWTELAAENSDDPGSASQGGVLGWFGLAELTTKFVPQFGSAVANLSVGEVSQPVRTKFGYHIIQVTAERESALALAQELAAQVKDDPDSFADVARHESDDQTTASKGGDLGWVIRYQLDAVREKAIFDLTEPGQISEPVVTTSAIYIFKLDDTAENRFVPATQRDSVSSSGFQRWIEELKVQAGVWIDPEFGSSTTAA
jgi:parvulin-like peptidyl-prolyl isomerase